MRDVGLIAASGMVTLLSFPAAATEPVTKTIRQLMSDDLQPAAETYWNAVQYVVDDGGERDIAPETEADWQRTRDAATRIGKLGGMLQGKDYARGRGDRWAGLATSLVEVSRLAEKAAEARDPDEVFEVGARIYAACSACHVAYPPASAPEGVQEPL